MCFYIIDVYFIPDRHDTQKFTGNKKFKCTNLEICSWEGLLWLAALCALQGRQNVLADNFFRFVGPATGTGHVPQLVLGVGEGGHGLLSLVRLDLVPLFQPGPQCWYRCWDLLEFPRLLP